MKRILISGATSAIASACVRTRIWAGQGARFFLLARYEEKLQALSVDLVIRCAASVSAFPLNAEDAFRRGEMLQAGLQALGKIDIALIAHGTLPNQGAREHDADLAPREFTTSGASVMTLLTVLAKHFEQQKSGAVGVIASVAGNRGQPSNYLHGCAKAAVSAFCEGLRARLFKTGMSLADIRPGFVVSPMTQGLTLPAPQVAQPDVVARRVLQASNARSTCSTFWRLVMLIIRSILDALFKGVRQGLGKLIPCGAYFLKEGAFKFRESTKESIFKSGKNTQADTVTVYTNF